jgi:hypothetical protein
MRPGFESREPRCLPIELLLLLIMRFKMTRLAEGRCAAHFGLHRVQLDWDE